MLRPHRVNSQWQGAVVELLITTGMAHRVVVWLIRAAEGLPVFRNFRNVALKLAAT